MHLVLSLIERMSQRGARPNHPYPFPLLQRQIADLTGLTPVHVSRVLTEFRNAGLLKLSKGLLTITDIAGVEQIARRVITRPPCARSYGRTEAFDRWVG